MTRKKSKNVVVTNTNIQPPFNVSSEQLDTKLTRSELIEMIIAETEEILNKKLKEIKEEIESDRFTSFRMFELSPEEQKIIISNILLSVTHYHRGVGIQFDDNRAVKVPSIMAKIDRVHELTKERDAINERLRALNSKSAKTEILRSIMERDPNGQDLLARIKNTAINLAVLPAQLPAGASNNDSEF